MWYGTEDNVKEVELCKTFVYYAYFSKAGALQPLAPLVSAGLYIHIYEILDDNHMNWHCKKKTDNAYYYMKYRNILIKVGII